MRTLFRRCVDQGGGFSPPVRRDFPEILLPDAAAGGIANAGTADALPASWSEICSAAEFGASPLILAGAMVSYRAGLQTSSAGILFLPREGRVNIAAGAAGSEVLGHEFRYGSEIVVQLSNPGASTVIAAIATPSVLHRLAPVEYAASTRLSFKAAVRDSGAQLDTHVYGVAYDPDDWNLVDLGLDWEQLLKGQLAVSTEHTDYATPTSAATAYASGAYVTCNVNGNVAADADYLVRGVSLHVDPASGFASGGTMVDLAIGAAGSEVIQSRAVISASLLWSGWHHFDFPLGPFYWAQGERLAARVRDASGEQDCVVSCNMWRLP